MASDPFVPSKLEQVSALVIRETISSSLSISTHILLFQTLLYFKLYSISISTLFQTLLCKQYSLQYKTMFAFNNNSTYARSAMRGLTIIQHEQTCLHSTKL
jgi:hypothetical protein